MLASQTVESGAADDSLAAVQQVNAFSIKDALLIPTSKVPKNYLFEYVYSTIRNIDCNHFDSLYLKNLFNRKSESESMLQEAAFNYNHRLPLFVGDKNSPKFCSLTCSITGNNRSSTTITNNVNLKNNNLTRIGMRSAYFVLSFLIENDKKIGNAAVILNVEKLNGSIGYNIYSIDLDKWMLEKNLDENEIFSSKIKVLLFGSKLLVVSSAEDIYCYDLSNLLKPKFITSYKLSNSQDYSEHGMVCMKYSDEEIEILLFGGDEELLDESMTKLSISNYGCDHLDRMTITDEKLKPNGECNEVCYNCGYNTVVNSRNERILLIISPIGSLVLYNCKTNELNLINKFLPSCAGLNPVVISHDDHVHVIQSRDHFLINLKRLLADHGRFKDLNTYWLILGTRKNRLDWIRKESAKSKVRVGQKINVT